MTASSRITAHTHTETAPPAHCDSTADSNNNNNNKHNKNNKLQQQQTTTITHFTAIL